MRPSTNRAAVLVPAVLAAALAFSQPAAAQEGGWTDTAELSYVQTAGNAQANTFAFKNTLERAWERSGVTFKLAGLRAESTAKTQTAVGTPGSFSVIETERTDLTAENYLFNGRYDRKISDRFFWYAGGGWDRNRFAGIENRYIAEGGVGNVWVKRDDLRFKTSYAATFTDQEDVFPVPGADDTFAGLRASWDYLHKFGEITTYVNTLVVDTNLEESSDWRADMVNSVAVSMNKRLALKVSLQWIYDNQPSFRNVPLENPIGTPTGLSVPVELDELDTVFTTSLVINF